MANDKSALKGDRTLSERELLTTCDAQTRCQLLRCLSYEGRDFHFRRPLDVKVVADDDIWTYECSMPAIFAYGTTETEARRAFEMEFASSWEMLANESDENLTIDARQLKQQLRDCVERIVS